MMTPLNKTHEGCTALLASAYPDKSRIVYKIEKIDEASQTMEFRYKQTDGKFSEETFYRCYNGYHVVELKARYDKPVKFFTELKIAAIEFIHRLMGNIGFKMK
jgi:hypothetical protein